MELAGHIVAAQERDRTEQLEPVDNPGAVVAAFEHIAVGDALGRRLKSGVRPVVLRP